jgi:hypothetical protein
MQIGTDAENVRIEAFQEVFEATGNFRALLDWEREQYLVRREYETVCTLAATELAELESFIARCLRLCEKATSGEPEKHVVRIREELLSIRARFTRREAR